MRLSCFILLTALCRWSLAESPPPIPAAIPLPPSLYFFAAKATNEAGASDYSNEAVFTNDTKQAEVTLAWSQSTNAQAYLIFKGRASGAYSNTYAAGTNLSITVPLAPPAPSNLVVTITSTNLTNIQWRARWDFGWALIGKTNLCETNPAWGAFREWRGMGRPAAAPKQLYIQTRLE